MPSCASPAATWSSPGLPTDVPVRQWVLSVPHRLRYRLAYDHRLCRTVLHVFVRAQQLSAKPPPLGVMDRGGAHQCSEEQRGNPVLGPKLE